MPAYDGVRIHEQERFGPAGPKLSQQDPEQPVQPMQARPRPFPLEHCNLPAKREHVEDGVAAATEKHAHGGEE